ncbi:hypothetical protein PLICRDRAFT_40703 [Plicaturopsis crispa FD-325 SS-3]|nr:hypothetical protein PLICRDRAFT_40703 [Plicaturopsis crispa FD-325 SS-3]
MAQRRSPHRVSATSTSTTSSGPPPLSRKRYSLRRIPGSSRRRALAVANRFPHASSSHAPSTTDASDDDSELGSQRQVLVPLHPNLRRLPSRVLLIPKNEPEMRHREFDDAPVGAKRKRVASASNENEHTHGHPTRGSGRMKRLRSANSSDEEISAMDIDQPGQWIMSPENSDDEEDEDAVAEDSTDDHLISEASPRHLLRLRKDELVRLYTFAGLTRDAESLTKPEIVQAIVAARDDFASLPPSSPPGAPASEYSSEGDVDELPETPVGAHMLRRRATINDIGRADGRPVKNRSVSMGNIDSGFHSITHRSTRLNGEGSSNGSSSTRRRNTSRSSPATSRTFFTSPSPPATRLRSRKVSGETTKTNSARTSSSSKGKGKSKQVEFSEDVVVHDGGEESDLTDLAELEEQMEMTTPSPRRLRSNGRRRGVRDGEDAAAHDDADDGDGEETVDEGRRVTPMRKAKGRIGSLKESDEEDDRAREEEEEDQLVEDVANEEVDELQSSPSPSPTRSIGHRTPVKRRLRPRKLQTHTPPSDGDDEGEEEDGEEQAEESVDEDAEAEVDEATVVVTPRKLRNGKIVGDDEMEEDIGEEDEDGEDEENGGEVELESVTDAEEDIDLDAEGETESDESFEDVDLTVATTKTLVRLRRDDLVRLCEVRNLDVTGTKPQLASSLVHWRNAQAADFSSPSSVGTVRPPSTVRPRRRRSNKSHTPPVLMRTERMHMDEPRTPPISGARHEPQEPELELDLESLGLHDREIPPEKLTKLEKIGSGGFKDVFIGKFKGRKIAISEFRGQLSAMDIKELKLLGGFDHPNIVRFLGVSIPENTRETPVMIISELCSNGDLFDYVRNVPPPSLHKILSMMLDIARGLEYLHLCKPSVIHRDCKSSNILITARGVAKIADFGLAKVKQSTRSMVRSLVGTVNWQAPELWHAHPKYNHKVDVFSCAMVFWEMLQWHLPNKKFPWEGMNEHAIYEIVGAKRQRPSISGLRKQYCPEIVDLVERMWAHEHQDRPTMSEVVEELEMLVAHR